MPTYGGSGQAETRQEIDRLASEVTYCTAEVHLYRDEKVECAVYRCEREAGHEQCHWSDKGGTGLTWNQP